MTCGTKLSLQSCLSKRGTYARPTSELRALVAEMENCKSCKDGTSIPHGLAWSVEPEIQLSPPMIGDFPNAPRTSTETTNGHSYFRNLVENRPLYP